LSSLLQTNEQKLLAEGCDRVPEKSMLDLTNNSDVLLAIVEIDWFTQIFVLKGQ
jgi:hypothetical protein